MGARLTWKVPTWTKAGWVDHHPEIVARFGAEASRAVIRVRRIAEYRRDQPGSQDVLRTLAAIAAGRVSRDALRSLDDHCDAVLTEAAWRRFGTWDLTELAPEALSLCAKQALKSHKGAGGRPQTDDLALMLIRAVLPLVPSPPVGTSAAQARNAYLSDALRACRFAWGQKTVERLLGLLAEVG